MRLLTPEQVAENLQLHHLTVLKFIKNKKLKSIKIGRVYRIREVDLSDFLSDNETNWHSQQNEILIVSTSPHQTPPHAHKLFLLRQAYLTKKRTLPILYGRAPGIKKQRWSRIES